MQDDWLTLFREQWQDRTFIAFVGTGRIGTEFFASFFNSVLKEGISVHEPIPDAFNLSMSYIRGKRNTQEAAKEYIRIRSGLFSQMENERCHYFVESNNNLSLLLPVIKLLFPNYKIVHIVRPPEDYVCSVLGNIQANSYSMYSVDDPRNRPTANDFSDDSFATKWAQFEQSEKIAWFWGKYNEVVRSELSGDAHYLRLNFVDLFKNKPYASMAEILAFLDIPSLKALSEEEINSHLHSPKNSAKKKIKRFEEWPIALQEKCKTIFKHFGAEYSLES